MFFDCENTIARRNTRSMINFNMAFFLFPTHVAFRIRPVYCGFWPPLSWF